MAKKLLNENTIRRFMKLADMNRLSENFIGGLDDDDSVEEGMGEAVYARDDEELGAELPPEEVPEEELDVPVEEEVPEEGREELARKAIEAVAAALDIEVEIEGGGAEEEFPAEELPAEELPAEELPEEEPVPLEEDCPDEEEEELMEKVLKGLDEAGIEIVDDNHLKESLIKKITARVAKRILAEKF